MKLSDHLTQLYYDVGLGITVNGVAVVQPPAPGKPQIYLAGMSLTGGKYDVAAAQFDDDLFQPQVLWHNPVTGQLSEWVLDAQGRVTSTQTLSAQCGSSDGCSQSWKVISTLDGNRDGVGDVLLYNGTTGELQVWLLNSAGTVLGTQSLSRRCGPSDGCSSAWKPVGAGDFNQDGVEDILWHNDARANSKPGC